MQNFLTWNYWFNLRPEALIPLAQHLLLTIIVILALATIVIAIVRNKTGIYHGFLNRLYTFSFINIALALLLFFANQEFVPFFSARFWLGAWALLMLVWLLLILRKLKDIPIQKKQLEQEKELKKYLP